MCSTARNARDSPLLRLPAELRTHIYILAIGGYKITPAIPDNDDIDFRYSPEILPERPVSHPPLRVAALNQTCRQLRHETKGLHFRLNTFYGCDSCLDKFLDRCGAGVYSIRSIRIRMALLLWRNFKELILRLARLSALETITLAYELGDELNLEWIKQWYRENGDSGAADIVEEECLSF